MTINQLTRQLRGNQHLFFFGLTIHCLTNIIDGRGTYLYRYIFYSISSATKKCTIFHMYTNVVITVSHGTLHSILLLNDSD